MVRRPSAVLLALLPVFLPLFATSASARDDKDPKPLEPLASIKPHEGKPGEGDGYFDEVFGIDDAGTHLAVIRSDGATFARIETYDLEAKPPEADGVVRSAGQEPERHADRAAPPRQGDGPHRARQTG